MEQRELKISEIVVDKGYLLRDGIDKETVEAYKENLEDIVKDNPIVVFDTTNGFLLADGFHRIHAARQLNWETIPTIIRKGSPQDAFAYACLANLTHGKPLTKKERKKAICEYIKIHVKLTDVAISKSVGYSDRTINNYRKELERDGKIERQETRIAQDGREIVTTNIGKTSKIFDVFDGWFDDHVVCGDVFDVLPKDERKYDLIIVDPPYGITNEEWDKKTKFDLLAFTRRWLNLVLQKLEPTGRLFVFWSREYLFDLKPLLEEIKSAYPLNFGGLIVWNFRNSLTIPNNRKELKITWEPIFYFYGLEAPELYRPDTKFTGVKWDDIDSDVWTYAIPQSNFKDKKIHPAQKPLELYKRIIELSTETNDLILDPFAGSGTTGHAAYDLTRQFTLVEKNPEYIEAIRNRLKPIFQNGKE